jgi:membrane-bound acyltransferase YfiQ involved in biofilm formation
VAFSTCVALQGLGTGTVILFASSGKHSRVLVFISEDLFFIYLLPPIIFNAGYGIRVLMLCSSVMVLLFYSLLVFISVFPAHNNKHNEKSKKTLTIKSSIYIKRAVATLPVCSENSSSFSF